MAEVRLPMERSLTTLLTEMQTIKPLNAYTYQK